MKMSEMQNHHKLTTSECLEWAIVKNISFSMSERVVVFFFTFCMFGMF
jgi:hypothetical protein